MFFLMAPCHALGVRTRDFFLKVRVSDFFFFLFAHDSLSKNQKFFLFTPSCYYVREMTGKIDWL